VSKRAPLKLDELAAGPAAEVPLSAASAPSLSTGPEPVTTIYVRAPWSLAERVKDIARERSKRAGKRVTVNELAIEALSKLA
jgi:hypothetical protein